MEGEKERDTISMWWKGRKVTTTDEFATVLEPLSYGKWTFCTIKAKY